MTSNSPTRLHEDPTKEYGCFFCSDKAEAGVELCPECHQPIDVSSALLAVSFDRYTPDKLLGRGFYGWTFRVTDGLQPFALKVVPRHRLRSELPSSSEVQALVQCSPHRNIARFFTTVEVAVIVHGVRVHIYGLLFEFIPDARPLRSLLADPDVVLARTDVVAILAGISGGLNRIHSRGLWHRDLHDDNILIRTVASDENIPEPLEAKLIDFGSAMPLGGGEDSSRGDYYYLAKHIHAVTAKFEAGVYPAITPIDRVFTTRLHRLAQRLADPHVSRRTLTPEQVVHELRRILTEGSTGDEFPTFAEMLQQATQVSIDDPLDNTNALTLEPQDVSILFRDAFGWQRRVTRSKPVIVVGPRGCGKTMLLRYLSMTSQARPQASEDSKEIVRDRLSKLPHFSLLLHGGQVRTPFLRSFFSKLSDLNSSVAEDFCREYINAHFLLQALRTVQWLQQEGLADIDRAEALRLAALVPNLLQHPVEAHHVLPDLAGGIERLERHVAALSNHWEPASYSPSPLSRDDVLLSLAMTLRDFRWMKRKYVHFLFDDYSVYLLPEVVQRSCNPFLFRPSPHMRMTVSSEGQGPYLSDSLGRKYQEGRELSIVHLGEIYFHAGEEVGRQFFEQILSARFEAVGKGSIEELITMLGEHEHEDGFGDYICRMKRAGDTRFFGFGLICRLCSGDVSFILELLYSLTRGRWGEGLQLAPKAQDEIVKRFAQGQLADLKRVAHYGEHLYAVAEGIGELLKHYLLDSCEQKHPDERLRIEIEGAGELCAEAQVIHEGLLRHSVLISGGSGKSRKGLPTRKFFFRRLFAPCFPFSPARKGTLALTMANYERWLLSPTEIMQSNDQPPGQMTIEDV